MLNDIIRKDIWKVNIYNLWNIPHSGAGWPGAPGPPCAVAAPGGAPGDGADAFGVPVGGPPAGPRPECLVSDQQ